VDTKLLSFDLFNSGKSIEEIAKERVLSANTIEGHLAHYIKLGELEATRLVEEEKLEKIAEYFEKAEDKSFGAAKSHFGEEVSYGELRIGLSYWEHENEQKN
jgi:uncharacterized protein YpbB